MLVVSHRAVPCRLNYATAQYLWYRTQVVDVILSVQKCIADGPTGWSQNALHLRDVSYRRDRVLRYRAVMVYIADDVIPLNSPGGSTLQWGVMRGLLCLTLFLRVILLHYLSFIFTSLVLSNYCRLQSLSCRKLCWSVLVSLQSCFVQSLKCCVGRGASKSLVKCCVVGLAMTRIFIRSVTATVRYRYLAIGCTSQETPLSQAAQ